MIEHLRKREYVREVLLDTTCKRFLVKQPTIANSIRLDERLTGFKWDNLNFRRVLELFDKYEK